MYINTDTDTKTKHIVISRGTTLCGLPYGWTDQQVPQKEKYGITCENCQYEIKEIKKLKAR